MNFLKRNLTIILFISSGSIFSQDVMYEDDTPILLRKEASFGATIHTSGWGLIFRRGTHVTGKTKRVMEAELVGMKHPKEFKTHYYEDSKPYVFGKLNSLAILRTGIGFQNVLYSKGDRNGLEIRLNYSAGISVGIAKPVFLYIIKRNSGNPYEKDQKEIERYNPSKHQLNDIFGKAEFGYGLGELSFYPGGYGKAGFSFEFGKNDRSVKAIETGAAFDLYPKKIPIMAMTKNNNYFVSLYVSVLFGGKW